MPDSSLSAIASGEWVAVGVSVLGPGHSARGEPCQDSFASQTFSNGCLLAVVSDGAGSAARSAIGSRIAVDTISATLSEHMNGRFDPSDDSISHWRSRIEDAIVKARQKALEAHAAFLEDTPNSEDRGLLTTLDSREKIEQHFLRAYHATVVGVLAGADGGIFFQIGDGAAIATSADDLEEFIISKPANGEVAEETFFFTEPDWRDNLRIINFGPQHDLILLMTDGAMGFAVAPEFRGPFIPFVRPLTQHLIKNWDNGGAKALYSTLNSSKAAELSSDDKTLVWLMRRTKLLAEPQ